jgi:cob(I)alamin adenosyltransferase
MSIKKSNIYTGGGDKGETSLIGGRRVPKIHPRIEAYGSVDELMAHTALLMDYTGDEGIKGELMEIVGMLMTSATMLASEGDQVPENLPEIKDSDINFLENSIDRMDSDLGPLTSFVLPGGAIEVSQAHISRTICRRTERNILRLAEVETVDDIVLRFFNRLSDYYFLLSRKLAAIKKINQLPWKP